MNFIPATNPDFRNTEGECVLIARGIPCGRCYGCGNLTNGQKETGEFVCTLCLEDDGE